MGEVIESMKNYIPQEEMKEEKGEDDANRKQTEGQRLETGDGETEHAMATTQNVMDGDQPGSGESTASGQGLS